MIPFRCMSVVVLFALMSGCSSQLTRMLISEQGSEAVAIVDLETGSDRGTKVNLPFKDSVSAFKSVKIDVHPWGNIGFAKLPGGESYKLNLNSGEVIAVNAIPLKSMVQFTDNGLMVLTAQSDSSDISVFGALNSKRISEYHFTNRSIKDMAMCADDETLLVVSHDFSYRYYLSRFTLNEAGFIANPAQEITTLEVVKDVVCNPSSASGAAIAGNHLLSFIFDDTVGLTQVEFTAGIVNGPIDKEHAGSNPLIAQSLAFSPNGRDLYVRFSTLGYYYPQGWLEKFSFNRSTAQLVTRPNWLAEAPHSTSSGEATRLTIHPDGSAIYMPYRKMGEIMVIDTATGNLADSITIEDLTAPSFISISPVKCLDWNRLGC